MQSLLLYLSETSSIMLPLRVSTAEAHAHPAPFLVKFELFLIITIYTTL
jgi:hypothetical protein